METKTVTKTIRLPPDVIAAIIEMAVAEDRSFTYVTTRILRQSLALKALESAIPKD